MLSVNVTLARCLPLYRRVSRLSTPLQLAHLPDTKSISAFCIIHVPERRLVECLLWQLYHVSPFCCLHDLTDSGRDVGAVYLHAFWTRLWGIVAIDAIRGNKHLKNYQVRLFWTWGSWRRRLRPADYDTRRFLAPVCSMQTIFCVLSVHEERFVQTKYDNP